MIPHCWFNFEISLITWEFFARYIGYFPFQWISCSYHLPTFCLGCLSFSCWFVYTHYVLYINPLPVIWVIWAISPQVCHLYFLFVYSIFCHTEVLSIFCGYLDQSFPLWSVFFVSVLIDSCHLKLYNFAFHILICKPVFIFAYDLKYIANFIFFSKWIVGYLSTICWIIFLSLISTKLHICVGLLLSFLFCSTSLVVFSFTNTLLFELP